MFPDRGTGLPTLLDETHSLDHCRYNRHNFHRNNGFDRVSDILL